MSCKLEKLSTPYVYPEYRKYEGELCDPLTQPVNREFHLMLETYVRKQHDGLWYLIPVLLRDITQLTGNSLVNQELQKADVRERSIQQFIAEAYKIHLFYIINPENIDCRRGYPSPMLYIDAFQGSEEERLIPKV